MGRDSARGLDNNRVYRRGAWRSRGVWYKYDLANGRHCLFMCIVTPAYPLLASMASSGSPNRHRGSGIVALGKLATRITNWLVTL